MQHVVETQRFLFVFAAAWVEGEPRRRRRTQVSKGKVRCIRVHVDDVYMYQMQFVCTWTSVSFTAAYLSSRYRLRGTQGSRLHTLGARLGPGRAPWRVLWVFKSRANWQVVTGWLSAETEPRKTMENPTCQHFALTGVQPHGSNTRFKPSPLL